jgi:hypothetical protein
MTKKLRRALVAVISTMAVLALVLIAALRFIAPGYWTAVFRQPAYIPALGVAYGQFQHLQFSGREQMLRNYSVVFDKEGRDLAVIFLPRLKPAPSPYGARVCDSCEEVHVLIDPHSFRVTRWHYAK